VDVNTDFLMLEKMARDKSLPSSLILQEQSPARRLEAALAMAALLQGDDPVNGPPRGVFLVEARSSGAVSVEDIQEGAGFLLKTPYGKGKNILVVDGADAMTPEAANSLLKLLEEPPDHAAIFLLTSDAGELLPTVRSRCTLFSLRQEPFEDFFKSLSEKYPRVTREEALFFHHNRGLVTENLPLKTLRDMLEAWKELFEKRPGLAELLKAADTFYSMGVSSRSGDDSLTAYRLFRAVTASLCRDLLLLHEGKEGQLMRPSWLEFYKKVDFTPRFLILLEELSELPFKEKMNVNRRFIITEIVIKFWDEEH